jgi:ATP-dependent Clp protease adaptor protein ClpS
MKVRDDTNVISNASYSVFESREQVETQVRPDLVAQLAEPGRYKVIMLNDDYTPMDFVIMLLKRYFYKSPNEALEIMLEIHHTGKGICGTFTKDMAETKVWQVMGHAKQDDHPLTCILEAT